MGDIVLAGATSGTTTLTPTAVSGTTTLTLPATTGTVITTGNIPTGSVVQVVTAILSTSFSTSSSSAVATGLKATITPSSSSNKILVLVQANLEVVKSGGIGDNFANTNLYRNASSVWTGYYQVGNYNSSDVRGVGVTIFVDSPSTTSATTYEYYVNSALATSVNLNNGAGTSTITLMEIKG
jgi:hypothetical protein